MKRLLMIALLVLLVLSASCVAAAAPASAGVNPPSIDVNAIADIDGVTNADVSDIHVTLFDGNGEIVGEGYTDEYGEWPAYMPDTNWRFEFPLPLINSYRVLYEDPNGYWASEYYTDANLGEAAHADTWEEATPIQVVMGVTYSIGEHLEVAPSDTAAPTTAADYEAAPANTWYQDGPTVTLTAADNADGSGVAATYYTLDGGAEQSYGVPFTVSGDGTHAVTFWSVDNAGNVEDSAAPGNTISLKVDGTAPSADAASEGTLGANGWYTSHVSVLLSAADNVDGSGLAFISYTFDDPASPTAQWSLYAAAPVAVVGEGLHTLSYRAADVAGNVSEASRPVNVDTGAPSTVDDYDAGQTHVDSAAVRLTAADATSGVASISYTLDGTTWTTSTANPTTVTVSTIGTTTISYRATDEAGNIETPVKSVTVAVVTEAVAPTTTATGLEGAGDTGWSTTSRSVGLTAIDSGGSGVRATYYTLDGVQSTYAGPFTVSGNGSHTVTYWSVDNVGNIEAANTGYVNIDTLAPSTSIDYTGAWTNKPVTLHFTGTDLESGVASTQYSTDGKKWVTGTSYTVSRSGQTTIFYRSTDNLGNVETAKQVVVRIDTTAPSIRLSAPKNKATYLLDAVVLAKWSVTDSLSGVASVSAPVASGQPIDTSAAGSFSFTVTATDKAGNTTTKTVTYSVR